MIKKRLFTGVLTVGLVAAAAAVSATFFLPDSASGLGASDVRPLSDSPVPEDMKQGLVAAAKTAGVEENALQEVAGVGGEDARSGIVVAPHGDTDVVAFYSRTGFTNFVSVADVVGKAEGGLLITSSTQAGPDGEPGSVQVRGVAAPSIERATVTLIDGRSVDLELVEAGTSGHSFFTYATEERDTFPAVVRAYSANGDEVATWDLTNETRNPCADGGDC